MSSPQGSMANNVEATPQKNNEIHIFHNIISFLKSPRFFKGAHISLRLVGFVSSLTAILCMITSHQSSIILGIKFNAQYSYSPVLKFFVIANAVACFFMLIPLFHGIVIKLGGTCPASCFYLFLNDLMMLTVLSAACGSATAIGDVGLHGNPHSGWSPICDQFRRFCTRITYSITFSYVSVLALFFLTLISALNFKETHV